MRGSQAFGRNSYGAMGTEERVKTTHAVMTAPATPDRRYMRANFDTDLERCVLQMMMTAKMGKRRKGIMRGISFNMP